MAAGFGFSVGDFVAGIELTAKVIRALKESGGASSEYQQILRELESLEIILQHLSSLKATKENHHYVNAFRGQAQSIQVLVQQFLDSITKYKSSLGATAHRGVRHGSGKKIQWTLLRQPEVAKLRSTIEFQISILNLLFNSYSL